MSIPITKGQVDRLLDLFERAVVVAERAFPHPRPAAPTRRRHPAHRPPPTPDGANPACPVCTEPMRLRHRRDDGAPFYGCSQFPECRGIRNIDEVLEPEPEPFDDADRWGDDDIPF